MNSIPVAGDLRTSGADHKKVTGMWFTDWGLHVVLHTLNFALFAACLAKKGDRLRL